MNKYNLKVLYPTSNKYNTKQYTEISVYADDLDIVGNLLVFSEGENVNDEVLVAIYPAQYTIVESIDFEE